jgi:hypothetical protein
MYPNALELLRSLQPGARPPVVLGGVFPTFAPELARIGGLHGADLIERPPELATPEALGEDAFKHGYEVVRDRLAAQGEKIELLALLFANAPTVTGAMIDQGVGLLRADPSLDSAVSVSRYNMWSPLRARRLTEDGVLEPFVPFEVFGDPATLNCDRDSQGDVYFADMGLSVVRPRCLERMDEGLLPQKWMGRRIAPIDSWGGCDVDYEWQVPQVEHWLLAHGASPAEPARPVRA